MIDCAQAFDLMLVAEPGELHGGESSELARHIATCAECRERASIIVAGTAGLGEALSSVVSSSSRERERERERERVGHAHAHAHGQGLERGANTPAHGRGGVAGAAAWKRRWMQRGARVMVPLAAAAALLLVVRLNFVREQTLPPILLPPVRVAEVPVVNAPVGRNVAVMQTSNANITVVWYY